MGFVGADLVLGMFDRGPVGMRWTLSNSEVSGATGAFLSAAMMLVVM